jgi:hypothetical protein
VQNKMRQSQQSVTQETLLKAENFLKKNKANNPEIIETNYPFLSYTFGQGL